MDDDVRRAVIGFLTAHSRAAARALPVAEADQLALAYLDSGFLDSMGVVELITTLEAEFGVRFAPEDMQSIEFRSVGGLVALVSRLRLAA